MKKPEIPLDLIHAHFMFVDIVGLTDPKRTIMRQIKKIRALNTAILSCEAFKNTDPNLIVFLPTGDGMAIGLLQGPEPP